MGALVNKSSLMRLLVIIMNGYFMKDVLHCFYNAKMIEKKENEGLGGYCGFTTIVGTSMHYRNVFIKLLILIVPQMT